MIAGNQGIRLSTSARYDDIPHTFTLHLFFFQADTFNSQTCRIKPDEKQPSPQNEAPAGYF